LVGGKNKIEKREVLFINVAGLVGKVGVHSNDIESINY
jgi:hypothetical protein